MNRAELRQLAEDRILDAECLLTAGRWSAAYYLAGYAVECGLKACIMAHVESTGIIFEDKKYSEKCWTHNAESLLELAALQGKLDIDIVANSALRLNWGIARDWQEISRYQQKSQAEAQLLYNAVNNNPDGVLTWIRRRW